MTVAPMITISRTMNGLEQVEPSDRFVSNLRSITEPTPAFLAQSSFLNLSNRSSLPSVTLISSRWHLNALLNLQVAQKSMLDMVSPVICIFAWYCIQSSNVVKGRLDASGQEQCSPEGNLPDAEAGPNGEFGTDKGTASTRDTSPNGHLRKVL